MGSFALSQCFESANAAASAVCSTYPKTAVNGAVSTSVSCTGASSDGSTLNLTMTDSTGASSAQALVLSFPSCDAGAEQADLGLIWAAGIAACAAVWAVKNFVLRLTLNQ